MTNPIATFEKLFTEAIQTAGTEIPSACCLSTIDKDGFPDARFVSLKEVRSGDFIITGPLQSLKFKAIELNNRVALTFWWPQTKVQVRIQGKAKFIEKNLADKYFKERDKASQIVSHISVQGAVVENYELLQKKFNDALEFYKAKTVEVPQNWGGIAINPFKIELLYFQSSRLHKRVLHIKKGSEWQQVFLQP